jgi:hypothetical protein
MLYAVQRYSVNITYTSVVMIENYYLITEHYCQSRFLFLQLYWVRVQLGLGFVGQRGEVSVRIVELSTPCKILVEVL